MFHGIAVRDELSFFFLYLLQEMLDFLKMGNRQKSEYWDLLV